MQETQQKKILNRWLDQHKGLVIKVIRSFSMNLDDREDLFQEVSIQLWNSIPNFQKTAAETTWIYRVALNTAMKWSKKTNPYRDKRSDFNSAEHVLIEQHYEEEGQVYWLYKEISKLNEVDKSVIILLLDGYSYREISEITGLQENNVGVRIHRIKKLLTQNSKQYDGYGI